MYRNCIHCSADLGDNEVIEVFPIGRRLAFDAAKGRLWVVCRKCMRWNLSPLEERWEAIEDCERLFRDTPLRAATEQIGLARVSEGLELVRIGSPIRPEFAAWRYGDRFARRHKRAMVTTTAIVGGFVAINAGLIPIVGLSTAYFAAYWSTHLALQLLSRPPQLKLPDGQIVKVISLSAGLEPIGKHGDGGWKLRVQPWKKDKIRNASGSPIRLTGEAAMQALRQLLPHINGAGAARGTVRDAVSELERSGEAPVILKQMAAQSQLFPWYAPRNIVALPSRLTLALEMALNEDTERRALEGELAELEAAWQTAEEIAAIADNLLIPSWVQARLGRTRRRPDAHPDITQTPSSGLG